MMAARPRRVAALAPLLALAAAWPLAAQTPEPQAALPPEIAAEVVEFYNGPGTIRMTGESRIAPGSEVVGDVAVLGGPLSVGGRIRGRLVVINGDLRLEPGGSVAGGLTVVGGAVVGLDSARVGGAVVVYRDPLRFRMEDGRMAAAAAPAAPELSAGHEFAYGRTDLTLAVDRGYNRVEGLPIVVGPRFETRSGNPTRAEALLIYRTEAGVRVDAGDLGYRLRLEQFLGGRRALRLGATLHSEVEPIDARGLTDKENSLATFLLRRDYRDHYLREGWSAYLRWAPPAERARAMLEYRDEEHASVAAGEPWAIFGGDGWRLQPLVAEGTLRSLVARLRYDTRNEGADPTAGWLVRAEVERGLGGSLRNLFTVPGDPAAQETDAAARPAVPEFARASLDLRRYARLGPTSHLSLRALVSGSLNAYPLPPQRQQALGGEGTLPGYSLFAFDCSARDRVTVRLDGSAFFPYYGCDRLALVQLEYHSEFGFGRSWGRRLGWDLDLVESPGWVVFFDAGRAWTERESRDGRTRGQGDFAVDVGAGLRLGRIGLYWAIPVSGHDKGLNFFVRIGPRF